MIIKDKLGNNIKLFKNRWYVEYHADIWGTNKGTRV